MYIQVFYFLLLTSNNDLQSRTAILSQLSDKSVSTYI